MGLCLRRLVLQYPWRGGRFQPESVVAFNRNQWQPSPGIGGRFRPESVATFARNTQPLDGQCKMVISTFETDIPHRELDLDAFLSIKPRIPISQELEQVRVLVGQIQNHESLS